MSIHLNSGPSLHINGIDTYPEISQGVAQEEPLADPLTAPEQDESASPSMRRDLMGRVAEQYADRDAFALLHRLNSSVLQAGLLHRVRLLGDKRFELIRHIKDAARDRTLATQLSVVIDRIRALPEPLQHAPLETLLKQCLQGGALPEPRQLCELTSLAASRSVEAFGKFSPLLVQLVNSLPYDRKKDYFQHFLPVYWRIRNNPGEGAIDYSATFLRALAKLVNGSPFPLFPVLRGALQESEEIGLLQDLRSHEQEQQTDTLTVIPYFLHMTARPTRLHYQTVFDILNSLPLKELECDLQEAVVTSLCDSLLYQPSDIQSDVADACLHLVAQLYPPAQERILAVMLHVGYFIGNYEGYTRKCTMALKAIYVSEPLMVIKVLLALPEEHIPHAFKAFLTYFKTEKFAEQREILEALRIELWQMGDLPKGGLVYEEIETALAQLNA
jgi:hypothetical protein